VYRLIALSLVFVVAMAVGWTPGIPFTLLLILLAGLIYIATLQAAPVTRVLMQLADTARLEYCLFGDQATSWPGLRGMLTPRYRPAVPWFAAGVVLIALGIALSEIADRGLVVLFGIPAAYLIYHGRRHMAPRANEVRQIDNRLPILILRSFQDDRIKTERFSLVPGRTFEQVIASVLKTVGPTITVGDPGEQLPRLGAVREYFVHDDWQTAVAKLMDEVALLVFVLGDTENFFWEFQQAVGKRRKADLLIIVPPLERQLLQSRWKRFRESNADAFGTIVQDDFPDDTAVCLFFLDDEPVVIKSRKRRILDLQVGTRFFLCIHREKIRPHQELRGFVRDHLPLIKST